MCALADPVYFPDSIFLDVFPVALSEQVPDMQYPEYFINLKKMSHVLAFVLHLKPDKRTIRYLQINLSSDKVEKNLTDNGKGALSFEEERPKLTWHKIAQKLRKPLERHEAKNMDRRVGFRFNHFFLVKAHFTFGQRFVEPGTAHVYQTTNVPILIYCARIGALKKEKAFFPEQESKYDMKYLPANGTFRVPPNMTYLILTFQKTFFSMRKVLDTLDNFNYVDVRHLPISRLQQTEMTLPMQTPSSEELQRDYHIPAAMNHMYEELFDGYQPDLIFLEPQEQPLIVPPAYEEPAAAYEEPAAVPPPPAYEAAAAVPPVYEAAVPPPPLPTYEAAVPPPPPDYEDSMELPATDPATEMMELPATDMMDTSTDMMDLTDILHELPPLDDQTTQQDFQCQVSLPRMKHVSCQTSFFEQYLLSAPIDVFQNDKRNAEVQTEEYYVKDILNVETLAEIIRLQEIDNLKTERKLRKKRKAEKKLRKKALKEAAQKVVF